jgi:hypothetical protein
MIWQQQMDESNYSIVAAGIDKIFLKTGIAPISQNGICVNKLYFQSYRLINLARKLRRNENSLSVSYRYDSSNLEKIYVLDSFENTFFAVPVDTQPQQSLIAAKAKIKLIGLIEHLFDS